MDDFAKSALLVFVLLNPFIMSVYLIALVRSLAFGVFARHLLRAAVISLVVFVAFALAGEAVFTDIMQVRFLAFLIFGGITFLIVGIRLIQGQAPPIELGEADSEQVSAAIAMPYLVGPGTISASVLAGSRLPRLEAIAAIGLALIVAVAAILLFKWLHDLVLRSNEKLVHRYTEIAGRATALFTGSFAIDMILTGLERWMAQLTSAG